jgi:hypothetical protein
LSILAVVFTFFASAAQANLAYTWVDSNYTSGGAGAIRDASGDLTVLKNTVTNLGGDPRAFSFKDHDGKWRVLIINEHMDRDDEVMVYDPADWSKPIANDKGWGVSIQGVASSGDYLYVLAYASNGSAGPGRVTRVNMRNGYKADYTAFRQNYTTANGEIQPVGAAIATASNKVYALYSSRYGTYPMSYEPSALVEYDLDLKNERIITIENGGEAALNSVYMASSGGSFYVGNIGGSYNAGSGVRGSVWRVTPGANPAASRLLDVGDAYSDHAGNADPIGVAGLEIAADGTMYVLTGGYYAPEHRFFKTNVSNPSWSKRISDFVGESILLDEPGGLIWSFGYTSDLAAYKADDLTLKTQFDSASLGGDVYTMAAFGDDVSPPPSGGGDGGNGGGGGCYTGAGAIALLFAAAAVAALRTRKV